MVLIATFLMIVLAVAGPFAVRSRKSAAAPRLPVEVTLVGMTLAPDAKGTDASAWIDNPNTIPLDVTLRVRWFDLAGQLHLEETIGPYRNLKPGGRRVIATHISATPLQTVTFEALTVEPSDLGP